MSRLAFFTVGMASEHAAQSPLRLLKIFLGILAARF